MDTCLEAWLSLRQSSQPVRALGQALTRDCWAGQLPRLARREARLHRRGARPPFGAYLIQHGPLRRPSFSFGFYFWLH